MLYLISAWSHNRNRVEVLESAISHLERGAKDQWQKNRISRRPDPNFRAPNLIQLKPLYMFYYSRYGKFYSEFDIPGLDLDQNMMLIRNTYREEREKARKELRESENTKVTPKVPTVQEEYERLIQKTKTKTKNKEKTIRID